MESRSRKEDALYLIKVNREKYEREKKERNDRFLRLQQERQKILQEREKILNRLHDDNMVHFPLSRQSNISTDAVIDIARNKIPVFEKKVQDYAESKEAKRRMLAYPYCGELGIRSYEPWQMKDFYFVRDFVNSWVDEILNYIIIDPLRDFEDTLPLSAADELQRQLNYEQHELELSSCVKENHAEIISEVCSELISDIVEEILAINYQSEQLVTKMILSAIMIDNTDDSTAALISNTFNQMKKERNKHPDVWLHTQKFEYLGEDTMAIKDKEEDTFDGKILSFDGIELMSNIPYQALTQDFKKYKFLESSFWSKNQPTVSTLPLPKRYKGVTCASLSSNHSLLAVGTLQGDIAIWNLVQYPPRILKGCKGNSSICQIQWSLNSMEIVTINQRGSIHVWSVSKAGDIADVKCFEPIINDGFECTQLINEITLEPKDLVFTKGNLASSKNVITKPTFVTYYPMFSVLGKQECLAVGMENGTILKLNLGGNTFPSTEKVQTDGHISQIGKGIEAELFKAHKHTIKVITFVDNSSQMLSLDDQGFIFLWEYTGESLSGYGWFTPSRSYRLDMTQKTYKPANGSSEKVEFTDLIKGTGRVKELNRQDMIKKRKEMQTLINSLHLGKPWRTISVGSQKVNFLYAPRNVPESGATFHSVTYYRKNKVLAQYSTQLYQPITICATKLMSCKANPRGNEIVVSLLFNEVPPKSPHVLFVTIDLTSMKISPNLVEVSLSLPDYNKCASSEGCNFDISRQIDATGSQYIFTNICGTLGGFSLLTTNLIMASNEQGWIGCCLSEEQSTVFSTARVVVASQDIGLCIVLFAPKSSIVNLLHIRDDNTSEDRKKVWQAYQMLTGTHEGLHPQQSLRKHQWTLDGKTAFHVHCAMETLVLDIVDKAIQYFPRTASLETESESIGNRIWPYLRHSSKHM